jgi:ankyrin repeat protein
LDHGAQVDIQDNDGWTALMKASSHDHTAIVPLLLTHGALVDIQSNGGETALMHAVESSKYGTIQLLMEHKALLSVNNAVLAEYYTKFSFHPVAAASDEQEDSSEDSSEEEEEEAADPIVINSICDLIKREQNWRRRKPWLLFWLALRRSVVAARSGTRARKKEGNLARPVLTLDFVGRNVASYL